MFSSHFHKIPIRNSSVMSILSENILEIIILFKNSFFYEILNENIQNNKTTNGCNSVHTEKELSRHEGVIIKQ